LKGTKYMNLNKLFKNVMADACPRLTGTIRHLKAFIAFAIVPMAFMACSDSDKTAGGTTEDAGIIADLNVAGLTQKGPFVKGSAVTVQGIDCKTLKFTDEKFDGFVKSDKGDFEVKDVNLSSTCAVFEVSGNYLNELTGKKSSEKLTLHALTDLKDRKNVNINVLTELEYERVMNLVAKKKMSFAEAKEQAEKEVLAAFNVKAKDGEFALSEDLNILESGNDNAALLAVSVLMQSDLKVAKLVERVKDVAADIAKDGSWDDDKTKTEIAEWAATADKNGELANVGKNIEKWGGSGEVSSFETVVEKFAETVITDAVSNSSSVILSSGSREGSSSSKVPEPVEGSSSSKNVLSSSSREESSDSSEYFDWSLPKQSYFNPNIKYDSIVDSRDGKVYKTVKIGNQVWMAENLNYADSVKTPSLKGNSWCYDNDPKKCNVTGRLYSWAAAIDSVKFLNAGMKCGDYTTCPFLKKVQGICPDGWHLPDTTEWNALFDAVGENAGNVLKSRKGWYDNGNGSDNVGFSVIPAGYYEKNEGLSYRVGLNAGFWSTVEYGKYTVFYTPFEYSSDFAYKESVAHKGDGKSIRCIKGEADEIVGSSSSSVSLSSSSSNSIYDAEKNTLKDLRDGQVYRTVKIGDQIWMAENLKYKAEGSHCYDDVDSNCDKYGPLYDWATAKNVCPTDWRLPTKKEIETLLAAAGGGSTAGKVLKSKTGWPKGDDGFDGNGTDDYSFSALPGGRWEDGGPYSGVGISAYFWSLTAYSESSAYYMYLGYENYVLGYTSDKAEIDFNLKIHAFSVRCVKAETSVEPGSGSSVDLEGWSWDVPKELRLNPKIEYDSITDSRDGKVYKTVKIGEQTWMAENLNYADSVKTPSLRGKSRCYNDDAKKCDVAGRLYTWAAAIDSVKLANDADNPQDCGHGKTCSLPAKVQGICPSGWHLPSNEEWKALFTAVGGQSTAGMFLRSQSGWNNNRNGPNTFGFSVLPVGQAYENGYCSYDGENAFIWSITEDVSTRAYSMYIRYGSEYANLTADYKYYGFSVRCLKD
jgi:uncharacterized protein (TIGR02145 family)